MFLELERAELRLQLTTAAVLALMPLLILPSYSFYYDVTPKVVLALLAAALGLVLLLRDPTLSDVPRVWADPLGRWFCLLAAAQLLSLLLSTFFSSHASLSWNGGNWRRFGLVSQCAVIVLAYLIATSRLESGWQVCFTPPPPQASPSLYTESSNTLASIRCCQRPATTLAKASRPSFDRRQLWDTRITSPDICCMWSFLALLCWRRSRSENGRGLERPASPRDP